jgi:HEPN domain-containing protein
MTSHEKFEYWLDSAQYDLESATHCYNTGRWLYVAYMCQQAIEKIVKGLYILYIDDNVPRIHNIGALLKRFEEKLAISVREDTYEFLDKLSTFYLNTRYPDYKQKMSAKMDKEQADFFLVKTKEAFAWLLTLKP